MRLIDNQLTSLPNLWVFREIGKQRKKGNFEQDKNELRFTVILGPAKKGNKDFIFVAI